MCRILVVFVMYMCVTYSNQTFSTVSDRYLICRSVMGRLSMNPILRSKNSHVSRLHCQDYTPGVSVKTEPVVIVDLWS